MMDKTDATAVLAPGFTLSTKLQILQHTKGIDSSLIKQRLCNICLGYTMPQTQMLF